MENKGIINFSDFIGDNKVKNTEFNKEEFNDFFLPENIEEENIVDVVEESTTEVIEESNNTDIIEEVSEETQEVSIEETVEDRIEKPEEFDEEILPSISESNDSYYSVFKDKSEDFSCDISLEGADLSNTEARLILETEDWNLVFNGEISKDGKCLIPIKKLSILNEGLVGKIKLEVIAEGTVFIPWEDDFKVKVSKKVSVKINETKSNPKRTDVKKSGVKVNIKR